MKPDLRAPIAVSMGAIPGALSRYYLGLWTTQQLGSGFPYGTMMVNLSGCFVMGLFTTLALGRWITIAPEIRLLIATGFLGAYTTFSSYELDTLILLSEEGMVADLLYWLGSAVFGVIAIQAGSRCAQWLEQRRIGKASD